MAFRFHTFSYGLGGIVALVHDIIVTYGAISIFGIEYSLSTMAVILTIIGFSINDTIVIFDRVRENIKKLRKENLATVMNVSINETLGQNDSHDGNGHDGGSHPLLFRRAGHPRFCNGHDRWD